MCFKDLYTARILYTFRDSVPKFRKLASKFTVVRLDRNMCAVASVKIMHTIVYRERISEVARSHWYGTHSDTSNTIIVN